MTFYSNNLQNTYIGIKRFYLHAYSCDPKCAKCLNSKTNCTLCTDIYYLD